MNERIRELAEQAGFSKDKYDLYWDDDANAEGVDLEKFAELIVQECATVIERNLYKNIGWNTSRAVKRHFGIEE